MKFMSQKIIEGYVKLYINKNEDIEFRSIYIHKTLAEMNQFSYSKRNKTYKAKLILQEIEEPMPEIKPGYLVINEVLDSHTVARVENDIVHYWSSQIQHKIHISNVIIIYNNHGQKIWERKK